MRRPGAKRPKFLAIAAFYSCSGWKISTKGVGIFYFRLRETIIVFGDVKKEAFVWSKSCNAFSSLEHDGVKLGSQFQSVCYIYC